MPIETGKRRAVTTRPYIKYVPAYAKKIVRL